MEAKAFCPAHVTGFFKAEPDGSLGAGFSIERGVATAVRASAGSGDAVSASGREPGGLSVSRWVVARFREMSGFAGRLEVRHELGAPVGCGLGCSAAAALSLAYALDGALGTGLGARGAAAVAHEAELECRTGLGDVLAAYHGGLEIRSAAGAPGRGRVEKLPAGGLRAAIACFAPVPTAGPARDRAAGINGLGGRMAGELRRNFDVKKFHDMSREFAERAGMMTPRMRRAAGALQKAGLGCGVAMFGETVFSLAPAAGARAAAALLRAAHPEAEVIESRIDARGARMVAVP